MTATFSRLIKTLAIIGLCISLASCTSTRLAYNFLDWWLWWEIDDYVDLDRSQKQLVKNQIDEFHQWHRTNELPKYSAYLNDLINQLNHSQPLTQEQLKQQFNGAIRLWQDSAERLYTPLIELMPQLSDKQVADMLQAMTEKSSEQIESYLGKTETEAKASRKKKLNKQLKKWLGKLTSDQTQQVNQAIDAMDLSPEPVIEARDLWQQRFHETMQHRDSAEFSASMQQLLIRSDELWSDRYRQRILDNQRQSLALMESLLASLNDNQRSKLIKKLKKYQSDFDYLAAKAQSAD